MGKVTAMTSPLPLSPYVIRYLRQLAGLTQAQLAARADVHLRTIRNVEAGRHEPLPAVRRSIEQAIEEALIETQPGVDAQDIQARYEAGTRWDAHREPCACEGCT